MESEDSLEKGHLARSDVVHGAYDLDLPLLLHLFKDRALLADAGHCMAHVVLGRAIHEIGVF